MTDISELPVSKYMELFRTHIQDINSIHQVVLTGHLIMESALDNILSIIFFHPEHLEQARLGFVRKVNLARAYALRESKNPVWNLILAVNSVRNEIAHNLGDNEKRHNKMAVLRRLYLHQIPQVKAQNHKQESDVRIAVYACAFCTGFLSTFEEDNRNLRKHIDTIDEFLNPDGERIKAPQQ